MTPLPTPHPSWRGWVHLSHVVRAPPLVSALGPSPESQVTCLSWVLQVPGPCLNLEDTEINAPCSWARRSSPWERDAGPCQVGRCAGQGKLRIDLFLGLGDIYTGVALKWLFKRYVLCTFHNFFNSLWIDRLPITLIYFLWFTSYYFLHFDGERKHLFFYVYF